MNSFIFLYLSLTLLSAPSSVADMLFLCLIDRKPTEGKAGSALHLKSIRLKSSKVFVQ